jgi:hypothetical protein
MNGPEEKLAKKCYYLGKEIGKRKQFAMDRMKAR